MVGAGQLLKKYLGLLCAHVADVLPLADSVAATAATRHFPAVAAIISKDVTGERTTARV